MRIKQIKKVGNRPVYDISVEDAEHYVLENGVVTHNTGVMYSSNTAFIIGRRQIKDASTKEIEGYTFILNAEKSRSIKEKSAIPLNVEFDGGIDLTSGLIEVAKALGYVQYKHPGFYSRTNVPDDKNVRRKDTKNLDWWEPILQDETFKTEVQKLYSLSGKSIVQFGDEELVIESAPEQDESEEHNED